MSIRSNVIISTVTALCVSNAIVLLLSTWLQCSTCGSRQSSFVPNAPSFEPAAIPDAAGSGLLTSSSQRLLYPEVACIYSSVQLTRVIPIWLADPSMPVYHSDRLGFHPGTGPPVVGNTYLYIYRYPGSFGLQQKTTLSATAFCAGAFGVVGSCCQLSIHAVMPNFRYEPDYSFQLDVA